MLEPLRNNNFATEKFLIESAKLMTSPRKGIRAQQKRNVNSFTEGALDQGVVLAW